MFELHANERYGALSEAREQLNRRLDIYTQQYKAKEAQYAELGIVRKRNLEKVLRTLQRQGKSSSSSSSSSFSPGQTQQAPLLPHLLFTPPSIPLQKPLPPPAAKP